MTSIIICCYEEEPIIRHSWNILKQSIRDDQIIFVDDGSTDKTHIILSEIQTKEGLIDNIITYPKNKGYGYALKQGLRFAREDVIVTMDADLAMNPEEILTISQAYIQFYDVVIFSRHQGIKADYPLTRRIASAGYRLINKMFLGLPYKDTQSGFIAFRKSALEGIDLECNDFAVLVELIAKFHKKGLKIIEVPAKFKHDITSGQTSIFKSAPKMFLNTLKIRGMLK